MREQNYYYVVPSSQLIFNMEEGIELNYCWIPRPVTELGRVMMTTSVPNLRSQKTKTAILNFKQWLIENIKKHI